MVKCGNPDCHDSDRRHMSAGAVRRCYAFSRALAATLAHVALHDQHMRTVYAGTDYAPGNADQ